MIKLVACACQEWAELAVQKVHASSDEPTGGMNFQIGLVK